MGSVRRRILASAISALFAATLVAGLLLAAAPAGAVPAKGGTTDPCSLITDSDLGGLSATYSLDTTDELSATNCLYSLQGNGESANINLFVDKPSEFSMQKAILKKVKKVSGLPSGYSGTLPGNDAQVGFKTSRAAISLGSSNLDVADLVVAAKAAKKHLG
jgi:hypothetical protein